MGKDSLAELGSKTPLENSLGPGPWSLSYVSIPLHGGDLLICPLLKSVQADVERKRALNMFEPINDLHVAKDRGRGSVILFNLQTLRQHLRELPRGHVPPPASQALCSLDLPPFSLAAPSQSPL